MGTKTTEPKFNVGDKVRDYINDGKPATVAAVTEQDGMYYYNVYFPSGTRKTLSEDRVELVERNTAPVSEAQPVSDDAQAVGVGEDIRRVTVPTFEDHEGIFSTSVLLRWVCPNCGAKRTEPFEGFSYDGSRRLNVTMWTPCQCGHIDKYSLVRKEAAANGLNNVERPQPAANTQPPAAHEDAGDDAPARDTLQESVRAIADFKAAQRNELKEAKATIANLQAENAKLIAALEAGTLLVDSATFKVEQREVRAMLLEANTIMRKAFKEALSTKS